MYYQQGILSLKNSTGYSNVPFNDIPIGCGFPNTVFRQCVPSEPPSGVVSTGAGFRINVNSAYVYPENNNLILKNPVDFDLDIKSQTGINNMYNSIYYNEKLGFNNCYKHINTKKYIGFDASNNFILVDSCNESNNLEYDKNNFILKRKLTNNYVNPNTNYNIVPNNTSLVLSDYNPNVQVNLELMNDFIAFYAKLKQVATTEYIMSVGTSIIPSAYSNTLSIIPTKYFADVVTYTKVRYSRVSILIIIYTLTSKRAFLTFDDGITWRQLTNSSNIYDGDMSSDGKYITLCENNNIYYISQNADTINIILKKNTLPSIVNTVTLSKLGKFQCLQNRNDNYVSNDFGTTFKNIFLASTSNIIYNVCSSYSGEISISVSSYMSTTFNIKLDYINNIMLDLYDYFISNYIPQNSISEIKKVQISEGGKYIFILDTNNLVYNNNYIRKSNWIVNNLQNIKNSIQSIYGSSISNLNKKCDMVISKYGKFVYLIYKILKLDNTYGGLIFYSNDYGNNFKQLKTNNNFINNNLNNFTSLDISPDGLTLILSDTQNVYKTTLSNEIGDDITEKNTFISIPSNEYKYLLIPSLSNFTKSIKNGNTIYRISGQNILVDDSNTILITIPVSLISGNISSICKSDDNNIVLYSIGNNIYNKNSNVVYTALSPIVFLTFKNLPNNRNMYIALSDKIHYSNDGILWYTVNMIPKKWVEGCIVPTLINNNFIIYCIEEFGKFYFSSDNGITWKSNDILENYSWISLDCSTDGKIVIATIKNNLPLISYDGGLSFDFIKFNETLLDISGNYIDCSINDNGSIISIVLDNGRIIISNDFGKSWKYYGDYYFYQNDIDLNKKDTLYTFSSSFVNTNISGYTYTNSNILNAFSKNMFTGYTGAYFSYFPNQTGYSITYGQVSGQNIIYTGLSNTNSLEGLVQGDFIEIRHNYLFKLNSFLLGGINSSPKNFDSFIRNCNIFASLDGINYEMLGSNFSCYLTWYASIIKFIVNSSNYYKVFRIVIRSVKQNIDAVNIYNLSFEGDVYTPTTTLNTVSKWNNIVIKSDRILAVRNNNQLLHGFTNHPIFLENNLSRVVSDYTYTNSISLPADVYFNNLTINSGVTIRTNGYRIFCRGKLTNNGIITNDGNVASKGTSLGKGGEGGTITSTSSTPAISGSNTINTVINSNGGRGGNRSNNAVLGGAGGVSTTLSNIEILYNPQYSIVVKDASGNFVNGGAGGGGGANGTSTNYNGGAGGRGGGIIMICANEIENNGTITVIGQNGFNASPTSFSASSNTQYGACGGGGGGGGTIIVVTKYTSNLLNTGFIVSGGQGGLGQKNTSTTFTKDSLNISLDGTLGENGRDGRLVVVFV
jgi:hypothetical protein